MRLRPRVSSGRSTPDCSRLQRKRRRTSSAPTTSLRAPSRLQSTRSTTPSTGVMPSVFVLEHGRLWLVAQRGYAVVPDGITVERGITGRAIRLGRAQLAPDVSADADYVAALPGVVSELAVPLSLGSHDRRRAERRVGARAPRRRCRGAPAARSRAGTARRDGPVGPDARSRRARAAVRPSRQPPGAARHRGARCSVAPEGAARDREPDRDLERARRRDRACGVAGGRRVAPAALGRRLEIARAQSDPSVVCQVLALEVASARARADAPSSGFRCGRTRESIGALVGDLPRCAATSTPSSSTRAARARRARRGVARRGGRLERERRSAVTDPLTGSSTGAGSRICSSASSSAPRSSESR